MTLASMKTAPLPLIVRTELELRVLASIHKGRFNPVNSLLTAFAWGAFAPWVLLYAARYSVWW